MSHVGYPCGFAPSIARAPGFIDQGIMDSVSSSVIVNVKVAVMAGP